MTACRYFAFGSNLQRSRLEARVGPVEVVAIASLADHRFTIDKRGSDGSAKANVVAHRGERVWGVVYALPPAQLPTLDRFEGGYVRVEVEVAGSNGPLRCWTYRSDGRCDDHPFDWYKAHIVRGAEEHGLPPGWREMLAELPCKPSK